MGVNNDPIETQRLIKTQEQPVLRLVEIRWWALNLRYLLYSLGNEDLKNFWSERWHDEALMQGNTVSGIPIRRERVHQLIIQKVIFRRCMNMVLNNIKLHNESIFYVNFHF